jgi:hypothetical protein
VVRTDELAIPDHINLHRQEQLASIVVRTGELAIPDHINLRRQEQLASIVVRTGELAIPDHAVCGTSPAVMPFPTKMKFSFETA